MSSAIRHHDRVAATALHFLARPNPDKLVDPTSDVGFPSTSRAPPSGVVGGLVRSGKRRLIDQVTVSEGMWLPAADAPVGSVSGRSEAFVVFVGAGVHALRRAPMSFAAAEAILNDAPGQPRRPAKPSVDHVGPGQGSVSPPVGSVRIRLSYSLRTRAE